MSHGWYRWDGPDLILWLRAKPRASRTGLGPVGDGYRVVRLQAPPVEGAANVCLIEHLAQVFGVPRRAVTIEAGIRAPLKRVCIHAPVRLDALGEASG